MPVQLTISVVANFVLIATLVVYGFRLFAEYHAHGKWARNVTALLSGLGMLALALALVLTPENASVLVRIAGTNASRVFLWFSTGLLLSAITAFGVLAYAKPFRLRRDKRRSNHRREDEDFHLPTAS